MSGPLNGAPDVLAAGHPLCRFIPRSGCSRQFWPDKASFILEPWALPDPTAIMGPILETVTVSLDVEGVPYEESDDA
jgi:hypothetical protein